MKKIIYLICAALMCMHSSLHAMDAEQFIAAARRGNLDEVQRLIDAGIDIDVTNNRGDTALNEAVVYGHTGIVMRLIESGANVNKNPNGQADLMWATLYGFSEIADLLLQAGADVNYLDEDGKTILMLAADNGRIDIVRKLLQAGARVNYQSKDGMTTLMLAVQLGSTEIVKLLLQAGADVNLANVGGLTALMIAVQHGYTAIINSLLHAGVDITARDWGGMRAYDHAVRWKMYIITDLLLTHANMLNELDRQAQTFIEAAQKKLLGAHDQVVSVDNKVIFNLIKYYRPVLVECLNWGIIKENAYKELILDKALMHNDLTMLKALIASEYQIPKSILQKSLRGDIKEFLEKHLARVETLYGLRRVQEEEKPQKTLGLMPIELMSYLVSWLAIDEQPASNA